MLGVNLFVKCCAADCRFRNAVADALEHDRDVTEILSGISQVQVKFRCTKCGDTYMHEACYQRVEEQLCKAIRANSSTLSEAEMCKAIFDTSRSGKFDMVRDHRALICSCKSGKLCAVTEGRKIVKIGEEEQTLQKKRRKKKSPQNTAPKQLFYDSGEEEELDEEQSSYMYRRQSVQIEDELDISSLTLDDFNNNTFPELPPNALPPPRHQVRPQQQLTARKLDFRIHNRGSFHTLSLSSAGSDKWKPRVIGKRGATLKTFITTQKRLGIDVDRVYIEDDQHGLTRIIINGKKPDDRECCAHALQHMIQGMMV